MNEITAFNATGANIEAPETMPHSIEAEQQLLGAILTNNDIYDRIESIIGPEHFLIQCTPVSLKFLPAASRKTTLPLR